MRVGVGLPNTISGVDGRSMLEWARRAEAGPFTSLGVLDRVAYESFEPFITLAAAAATTSRIGLVTMVVIGPLRSPVLLAKQAASIDEISAGRLTLGLAVGARQEDYRVLGLDHRRRGETLTDQLVALKEHWEDRTHVPGAASGHKEGPIVLVGGLSGEAFARMARYADGYVHGGGPPRAFAAAAGRARAAWIDAGRPGEPQLWGQSYFALGDPDAGEAYLRHYYAFTGAFAERIAAGLLTSAKALREHVS